jgi:dihydropteroate synthase
MQLKPVRLMGIVNVTPDSFSGDGCLDQGGDEAAISHGMAMAQAGAHIIDVGGESTRPGHTPVSAKEEIARVRPVVAALASQGLTVSIDTSKAEVAQAALQAGARIVNDVWGLRRSPEIARLAAHHGAGLVLMHNQEGTVYQRDLLVEIANRLRESAELAVRAGVDPDRIVIDPGIGFGKTPEQNVIVIRRLSELTDLGYPILVGPSRKSFLGRAFGQEMPDRIWGTAAAITACVLRGAELVRVHDVHEMAQVTRVAQGLR